MLRGAPNQEFVKFSIEDFDSRFKSTEKFFKVISWFFYTATLNFISKQIHSHILKFLYYLACWKLFMLVVRFNTIFMDGVLKLSIISFVYRSKYFYILSLIILTCFEAYITYLISYKAFPSLINIIANLKKS